MAVPSDDSKRTGWLARPSWGSGMTMSFLCPRCRKPRQTLGRRKANINGLRQWVCHECTAEDHEGAID